MLMGLALGHVSLFKDVLGPFFCLYSGQVAATKAFHFAPYTRDLFRIKDATGLWTVIICVVD